MLPEQFTIRHPIAISLGAIAGSLSRYYLGIWLGQILGTNFPYGTLAINLTGCFGMGFFVTLASERIATISPELGLLVAVGFLGSYTTFSTYELDTVNLLRSTTVQIAILYWLGSAILGLISIQLGSILAKII
ncbi:MAG: fluoride efflux transporter CrcB [Spirulinaceae cyanobacterium]